MKHPNARNYGLHNGNVCFNTMHSFGTSYVLSILSRNQLCCIITYVRVVTFVAIAYIVLSHALCYHYFWHLSSTNTCRLSTWITYTSSCYHLTRLQCLSRQTEVIIAMVTAPYHKWYLHLVLAEDNHANNIGDGLERVGGDIDEEQHDGVVTTNHPPLYRHFT